MLPESSNRVGLWAILGNPGRIDVFQRFLVQAKLQGQVVRLRRQVLPVQRVDGIDQIP